MAVFDGSFFPVKDFAYGTVMTAPSPAASGTSMVLNSGQGALFPAPATAGVFRAYVWPATTNPDATNCEEIEVTVISTDTFTMVRHKSGIEREILVGDQVAINFGKSKEDQLLSAIKDGVFEDKLLPGESYSRDSTTQFKTPGDKTGWYTEGRVIRVNNAGTYTAHVVDSSSYSAPDTTVIIKTADLPAALTNVYVAIQPKGATNKALPLDNFNFSMARQALINGNFDVWQRGVTATNPASGTLLADRWWNYNSADSGTLPTTITHSRQLLTSGDIFNAFYHYRIAPNGAGTSLGVNSYATLAQHIENGTRLLCGANKRVTVSFWARSSITNKQIAVTAIQYYGSGGSPSAQEKLTGKQWTLTSSWTKYTYTFTTNTLIGKTFGTSNDDYLSISLQYVWGSTEGASYGLTGAETYVGSGNIDIAQVQLCAGDVALPFQPKSENQEKLDCYRYCYGITATSVYEAIAIGAARSTTVASILLPLPVQMRTTPILEAATATDFMLTDGVTSIDLTALVKDDAYTSGEQAIALKATVASGLTQFRPYQMISDESTGRTIIISSEL